MIARSAVRQIPRGVIVGTKYGYIGTRRTIHSASKKAVKLHQKGSRWRWLVPTVIFIPLLYMTTSQLENKKEDGKPAKAWQVTAYSTLPLKALSRAWGRFNDVDLPVWLRAPGFKLYAWIFGANLDEIADPELTHYRNLGEFFYRELKPGARPIADSLLVSPCDGKVLQIGQLVGDRIEQVKGVSYSLESFIGIPSSAPHHRRSTASFDEAEDGVNRDQEFARLNGIPYTVDDIVGESDDATYKLGDAADVSEQSKLGMAKMRDYFLPDFTNQENKRLCFAVIYLAPGDYHRFHSPTAWVAQLRRHFVGDLFSVAPYFQKKLADLFCLNERVAILGRWRHGFFSMIPVGATNVGNIQINFDKFLKTNSVYVKEQAEGELIRANKKNCYEATYASASPLLKGVPLSKGEEMGGFHLGSTVVLVFEAPETFKFEVSAGDVVKVGQRLGD